MAHDPSQPLRVVGLAYEPGENLPQVILKGSGPLAEKLLETRRESGQGPAVVKNETLLASLYRLPIDSAIGPELFHAVAAILAHVLAVDARHKNEETPMDDEGRRG